MATQAWLLFDATQKAGVEALNASNPVHVIPRAINNTMADQLSDAPGTLTGSHFVAPARLLNDPDYVGFVSLCETLPIYTWDSDVLFLPPSGDF